MVAALQVDGLACCGGKQADERGGTNRRFMAGLASNLGPRTLAKQHGSSEAYKMAGLRICYSRDRRRCNSKRRRSVEVALQDDVQAAGV